MKVPYISSTFVENTLIIRDDKTLQLPPKIETGLIHVPEQNTDIGKLLEAEKAYFLGSNNITFGYHHPLKTLFVKGKLPFVHIGFYGERINPANVTIEHIKCVSEYCKKYSRNKAQKLATVWENIALTSADMNHIRGCDPLSQHLDFIALGKYLDQFKGQYIPDYGPGEKYIKGVMDTVNKLLQDELKGI